MVSATISEALRVMHSHRNREKNMTTNPENIIEGIQRQCDRVRKILPLYDEIPTGVFAATMMRNSIKAAEAAIASGDVLAMLSAYKDLEGYEA